MRGLPIGYTQSGKLIRYEVKRGFRKKAGESSLLLIGPPRSGKNSIICPHLHDCECSIICPCMKGQLSGITARWRRRFGKVGVVDPMNIRAPWLADIPNLSINPLEEIDLRSPEAGLKADAIGEMVIPTDVNEREKHWPESARDVVSGVTLAVLEYETSSDKRDLVTVYERISGPDFFEYAQAMVARGNPMIVGRLGRVALDKAKENREMVAIQSTAMTHFRFLGNQAVRDSLRSSRSRPLLRWQELRKSPYTVYPIIPVEHKSELSTFLRIVMGSGLSTLASTKHMAGVHVYVPWDEFRAVGHLSIVTSIMSLSAGLNLTMMPVMQSADQLKVVYGDEMDSFFSMAGCQMILPPRDLFTARLVSDLCGEKEVISRTQSLSFDHMTGEPNPSYSASQHGRPLLSPDEVMALGAGDMLIRMEGVPDVILAKRRDYWKDGRYRGLDADPCHPKKKGWW